MIHNTYIVRISTYEILASSQYWPVEVEKADLEEFITTREDLRKEDSTLADFPLIIGDDKFQGRDLVKDIVLVFVTDKGEEESAISVRLDNGRKALQRQLLKRDLSEVLQKYGSIIEPSVITRLKIALVGEGGVGKTTTLHLLMGDTPPLQYVPTIALNLETVENIRFGNYSLVLWDFAGQERFRRLWKFYFHGADVIFLVCDSSLRNVIISKDIYKLIKRDAPKVPVFSLANKQDKPNAMRPEVVQKILGIPTYPMVAIDKSRRDEMLRILLTAAAQFVGVVLPDLPASELLRFTDAATADAIEVEELGALVQDEEEEEEIVEEVFVDKDGHIISAEEMDGEYEIIEETIEVDDDSSEGEIEQPAVVEEILSITDEDVSEPEEIPLVADEEEEIPIASEQMHSAVEEEAPEEIPFIADEEDSEDQEVGTPPFEASASGLLEEDDIPEEPPATEYLAEEEVVSIDEPIEDFVEPEEEMPSAEGLEVAEEGEEEIPMSLETSPEAMSMAESWVISVDGIDQNAESSTLDDILVEAIDEDDSASREPLEEELGFSFVKDESEDTHKIAKEIISEALDADDIISAEIDRVSKDELDVALEAFSSDETMPSAGESETTEEIAEEALRELEDILGPVDEPSEPEKESSSDEIQDDLDALDALFALMAEDEDKTQE
ncbi:MAG: ADP-ribosylation factor-like protein [Candidatus Thorarchaeota archaeon]|nr:ADP-ribosylation factor-like protein [Candidatus Thorarchaeota archaeon]